MKDKRGGAGISRVRKKWKSRRKEMIRREKEQVRDERSLKIETHLHR